MVSTQEDSTWLREKRKAQSAYGDLLLWTLINSARSPAKGAKLHINAAMLMSLHPKRLGKPVVKGVLL
jgi:hypothetical protein